MNFGGERLFSLFFLLILVRICTVKPLFCKKNPAARAKFLGSAYFRIFSRSAYYFHFSAFRKFWRALIILRKSSEMTLERLLRGGLLFAIPWYLIFLVIYVKKTTASNTEVMLTCAAWVLTERHPFTWIPMIYILSRKKIYCQEKICIFFVKVFYN